MAGLGEKYGEEMDSSLSLSLSFCSLFGGRFWEVDSLSEDFLSYGLIGWLVARVDMMCFY